MNADREAGFIQAWHHATAGMDLDVPRLTAAHLKTIAQKFYDIGWADGAKAGVETASTIIEHAIVGGSPSPASAVDRIAEQLGEQTL